MIPLALLFAILYMPVCATVAGVSVWLLNRNQEEDDAALFRLFTIILVTLMLAGWGISKTDAARMRLDPVFRIQTELNAHPIYSTIKRFAPDDLKQLEELVLPLMSSGVSLNEAFLQARPLLTHLANYRLGFSDQKTHLIWAQVVVDSLKELQARDPELCYYALSHKSLDEQALTQFYSSENTASFQRAIVALYESADRGMSHNYPADETHVEFNAAVLEYRVVQDAIEKQFGRAVSEQLRQKSFPEVVVEPADKMCAARIFQLESMLERPQAMASRLTDSVLR